MALEGVLSKDGVGLRCSPENFESWKWHNSFDSYTNETKEISIDIYAKNRCR